VLGAGDREGRGVQASKPSGGRGPASGGANDPDANVLESECIIYYISIIFYILYIMYNDTYLYII